MSVRPGDQQGFTTCAMANAAEGSSVEEAFIELANKLADAAAEITTKFFRCAAAQQAAGARILPDMTPMPIRRISDSQ